MMRSPLILVITVLKKLSVWEGMCLFSLKKSTGEVIMKVILLIIVIIILRLVWEMILVLKGS